MAWIAQLLVEQDWTGLTQTVEVRSQWAVAQRVADRSRVTRAAGARSQLAATLGAVGQVGLVSKPFAEASGKKGFGCCTSQSMDCSGRANCIRKRVQQENQ